MCSECCDKCSGLFLNSTTVKALILGQELIARTDPKQVEYMEGGTYDLRVDTVEMFVSESPAYIGQERRVTPKTQKLSPQPLYRGDDGWILYPGRSYLMSTVEWVNCPNYLRGWLTDKTTIFRDGAEVEFPRKTTRDDMPEANLHIKAGMIQPGYQGTLTFKLRVDGPNPIEVERNARVVGICFSRIEAPERDSYDKKGKWQGGKVSSQGEEMEAY